MLLNSKKRAQGNNAPLSAEEHVRDGHDRHEEDEEHREDQTLARFAQAIFHVRGRHGGGGGDSGGAVKWR